MPARVDSAGNQFGIVTSEGIVIAIIEGTATGLTNTGLTRLIEAGVGEIYSIQCDLPRHAVVPARRIFWHVASRVRYPTAVISARFIEDSKTVRSLSVDVAAPEANPNLVFMNEVSHIARKVLPPPILPAVPGSPLTGCATDPSVPSDKGAWLFVPDFKYLE
jgi:hypothetical protein